MSKKIIGPKIKQIRKDRHLTQGELAELLGYSDKSVIAHIEKGDADMTYEKLMLLIKSLALDANDLFMVEKIDKELEQYQKEPKRQGVVIYIHGMFGTSKEIEDYSYIKGYDLKGLDYEDGNPYDIEDVIRDKFFELIKGYKDVIVIANSVGAFYTYEYLNDFNIKQAFFISPIINMFQIIVDLMTKYKISEEQLKKERYIKLENGTTLSYDFYEKLKHRTDNWKVPTEVLYGSKDETVKTNDVIDFIANHNARLTIKNGAHHYFHTKKEKEFIKNWILKTL